MKRKLTMGLIVLLLVTGTLTAYSGGQVVVATGSTDPNVTTQQQVTSNFPERPINLIVPTNPGGGIDLWNRVLASEMEKVLGQKILVNNMPGGGPGGTGTAYVWSQPHDGYSIVGCSETSLTIPVMTSEIDQTSEDYEIFIAGGSPGLLCVNKNAGYGTMAELIATAKAKPGEIKIASSSGGLWLILANLFSKYGDVPLGNATYDGSRSAITACVSGETAAVNASLGEVIDFIKSGDLIPLAVYDTADVDLQQFGQVEAITKQVPEIGDYLPLKQWIGFMLPNDVPADVKAKIKEAFTAAMASDTVKKFAEEQFAVIYNLTGEDSVNLGLSTQSTMSWVLFEMGKTQRSPEELGISKPGK